MLPWQSNEWKRSKPNSHKIMQVSSINFWNFYPFECIACAHRVKPPMQRWSPLSVDYNNYKHSLNVNWKKMPFASIQLVIKLIELIHYKFTTLAEKEKQEEGPRHKNQRCQNFDWIWIGLWLYQSEKID